MPNKTLAIVLLLLAVLSLAVGLLFMCAATTQPARLWLALVLLVGGGGLAAWSGTMLRRIRELDPSFVADRIVELVRRRGDDEITQADIIGSLNVPHEVVEQAVGILTRRQLVERQRREDRDILVFPTLRAGKVVRQCPYCGSQFSVKTPLHKCPNCGANLDVIKK